MAYHYHSTNSIDSEYCEYSEDNGFELQDQDHGNSRVRIAESNHSISN